ncbi:hypothetical protein [Sphingomonas sp. Leaf4]|nr:hypothetical protein [Sphingomonas sp. Leaf4]
MTDTDGGFGVAWVQAPRPDVTPPMTAWFTGVGMQAEAPAVGGQTA